MFIRRNLGYLKSRHCERSLPSNPYDFNDLNIAGLLRGEYSEQCASLAMTALYRKRLTATAFVLHVWVVEFKTFVQSFAREVQFRAIEIRQAFRVNDKFHTQSFKHLVIRLNRIGVLEFVRHA